MIDSLLSHIAPHYCCSCGEIGAILCDCCKIDILEEGFEGCLLCGVPCGTVGLCYACNVILPCEQAWCVGERTGGLKALIDQYKFSSSREAARQLASLLYDTLPRVLPDVVLVSIPTARRTERIRSFDHMGLIARELARTRHLTVARPLVCKTSQMLHLLSKKERENLSPELFVRSTEGAPKQVLLIDDIVTTGTTLKSAVKLLKAAGVEQIYVAVVARQGCSHNSPDLKKKNPTR